MKMRRLMTWTAAASLAGGLALTAQAAPLVIDGLSAAQAATQLSTKYGVSIVYKGDFGRPRRVSFTVDNADMPGARLEAINALANAVGADFTKTYVVSKVTDGETAPTAQVDSTALMTFPSATMPVQDAISLIASTDGATAQIVGPLDDTVTLSAQSLTAAHAADEVAKQTHTRWKTFYALIPRGNGRVTGGKVIGHTSGGQAIIELPYVYYTHPKSAAEQQREAEAARQASNQQAAAQQQMDQNSAAQQQMGTNGVAMAPNGNAQNGYGNGYNGFGNNGFGNNPYGFNGFAGMGYGNGGYSSNGSGLTLQSGPGYGGYGNGPIIFGSGY